jgi:Acetyltransferase (GNAT) domain
MLSYLKKYFYDYIPVALQQRLKTGFISVCGRMCLWLPIYRIEKNGLTVSFIGRGSCDAYLINLLYGEYGDAQKVGITAVWNINKTLQQLKQKSDMVLFRDAGFQPSGEITHDMFNLPYYVDQITPLPAIDSNLIAAFRDPSTVSDLHKIQKAGFSYHLSDDEVQLESFYHTMYKPYILSRHRDAARVPSWSSFRQLRSNMELLLITQGDRVVAGAINFEYEDSYMGYANGVLNADPQLLKAGVLSAIYWFGIVEAHRRGCRQVNLGSSRPFLKNGVLAYKKKWGSQIVIDKNSSEFRLFVKGNASAAQRFFETAPLICKYNNRLISLVVLGSNIQLNDKELSSYLRACLFQGEQLSTWIVLLNDEWLARKETIRTIVRGAVKSTRIIDLTKGTVADLPLLMSNTDKSSPTVETSTGLVSVISGRH